MTIRGLNINFPNTGGKIRNLKFYNKDNEKINISASSDDSIGFFIDNKYITASTSATSSDGTDLPYMALNDDCEWVSSSDAENSEWSIYINSLIVLGKDITKIEFEGNDGLGDVKLYALMDKEEVGIFNYSNGIYSIEPQVENFVVVHKKNQYFYRPTGLNIVKDIPKPEFIPYMQYINKTTSTTAVTASYTATEPGYVIVFAEGGTANNAGDGRPTSVFTEPKEPMFQYDNTLVSYGTSGWHYGTHIRGYYLETGETISINNRNASGNGYTYCFTGIYRMTGVADKYKITIPYKAYNANNTKTTYNHPANPKDKYALYVQFCSGGNKSVNALTLTSDDNSRIVMPEINNLFTLSTGGTTYVSSRLFKLPPNKNFVMSAVQSGSPSGTRVPVFCLLFSDRF